MTATCSEERKILGLVMRNGGAQRHGMGVDRAEIRNAERERVRKPCVIKLYMSPRGSFCAARKLPGPLDQIHPSRTMKITPKTAPPPTKKTLIYIYLFFVQAYGQFALKCKTR